MKKLTLLFFLISNQLFSQTPCEDGKAGSYKCLGLDLQSRLTVLDLGAEELNGIWVNDIWGWVDPETNKEYALVGMTNGTSFVDVTDPVNPVVLGILKEHNSLGTQLLHGGAKSVWRDIKVYSNHAYIVSEDPNHGMQVFDLTELRNVTNPPVEFAESGYYPTIGKAHNIVINEETGYAYAVGFNANDGRSCSVGGLHIIDLSDPKNPVFAGCYDREGYTHDAQCVVYNGPDEEHVGKEICFNSNEADIVIVDVSSKTNVKLLSKFSYEGSEYVHQGWLTEDHRYFLSNDELDEVNLGQKTRTFIWDVKDLNNPIFLGFYEHENGSIDHNLYTRGKYIYEANYTSGLRILDTAGISSGVLSEAAYFDTYVSGDGAFFDGAWSNYPYFPSGNIIVSDISNGLFVLKMQSLFVSQQPIDVTACVGEHLDIPIKAVGENLEYQWQIDDGSGFKNIDDFERYKNTQTSSMHAHTLNLEQSENKYRCVISNGETEITSDAMTLTVIDSPRAEFTFDITSITGDISFSNTSVNAIDYKWEFGDGSVSDVEAPTHKFQEDGIYDVMLIATNECTSDTTIQSLELIVAGANILDQNISIYPTIVNESFSVAASDEDSFTLTIYSLYGNKVLQQEGKGSHSMVDVNYLNAGMYIVNIQVGNKFFTKKIIIEK
ncbi:choice-of-anchor B family protein [Ekhidna sp.]|uniref:choice-of-anchor B family protein n=1 Tax=Ekhidna sp. TaxID=2608089 RepID=UPI003B5127AC